MKGPAFRPPAVLINLILATCWMLFLAGCIGTAPYQAGEVGSGDAWKTMQLRDMQTAEAFSVASFSGTPVILYTFTISCPICTLQQKEISAIKRELGDSIAVIGLDIDPKEEAAALKDHIRRNGFSGYYAISPPGMTQSLVDRCGPRVVTPASAPVMVICPGGDARLLETGIKTSAQLSSLIRAVC